MSETVLRLSYADEDELDRKLIAVMTRRGFTVEKRASGITVGELARMVGRSAGSVSRSLRRASCPQFDGVRGKRRYVSIIANERLLGYLKS